MKSTSKVLKAMYFAAVPYINDYDRETLEDEAPWMLELAEAYNEMLEEYDGDDKNEFEPFNIIES